jgi:quercetin dioxygenase-like cupin family protein
MKAKAGEVFSLKKENAPVPGCTVSSQIISGKNPLTVFSLGANTDISAEIHPYHKLVYVLQGSVEVYGADDSVLVKEHEGVLTEINQAVGFRTKEDTVYTELAVQQEDVMNQLIKAGEVFRFADMVPYQDGKIVNMDVVHNDSMKFVVIAFDAGTGLSEHAAPGEALIFALDGEAVITYEGVPHVIHAGENFHFAKGGLHAVQADKRFKMGLLLTL